MFFEELPKEFLGTNKDPNVKVCGPNGDGTWFHTDEAGVKEVYSVLDRPLFDKCQMENHRFGMNCYNRLGWKIHDQCLQFSPQKDGVQLWDFSEYNYRLQHPIPVQEMLKMDVNLEAAFLSLC